MMMGRSPGHCRPWQSAVLAVSASPFAQTSLIKTNFLESSPGPLQTLVRRRVPNTRECTDTL